MTHNILEYLERTARTNPQAGVTDESGFCSYADLLERSRRVGCGLLRFTAPNQPVPILMEKGISALTAFFGIVQAGCCYTLLNPDLPDSRLGQVLSVLKPPCILTDLSHQTRAEALFPGRTVLLLENLLSVEADRTALARIRSQMIDTDPLYINFTSGSTGVPKGVVIAHRSVLDFISVFTEQFHISSEDVIANQAPFDFDVSVKDIYSAIRTGADLVIVPKWLFSQPAALLDFLCAHKITTMIWAVSALCLITTFHGLEYRTPETVRKVLFSGEVMPIKHLNTWMDHLPEAEFVNLYGPTEITCNCTYHIIERNRDYAAGIPIGTAFPNERVFLLNEQNELVSEPEQAGELCVSGTAVGLGYYCAPDQTNARFPQNPLNSRFFDRIYRTGDLACWNEQGELRFLGRKDFQIKYKGHRIELEEIEKAMMETEGVARACCVFDHEKQKLFGFYLGTVEKKELHRIMSTSLPHFMVPGRLIQVQQMPLTKNGKTDRSALMKGYKV